MVETVSIPITIGVKDKKKTYHLNATKTTMKKVPKIKKTTTAPPPHSTTAPPNTTTCAPKVKGKFSEFICRRELCT